MAKGKIELKIGRDKRDVAYVSLPDHPGAGVPGIVTKQVRLIDLCGKYEGPDIYFDFDKDNRLLGIEILA